MPLYSLDEAIQPQVGRQQHWNLFRAFEDTPLHAAIVAELRPQLNAMHIDSTVVGSKVLAAVEAREPELLWPLEQDEVGGLFGMILWNLLAESPEAWYFYPKSTSGEEPGGTIYFRKR